MNDLISREAAIEAIIKSEEPYQGFMALEMYSPEDAIDAVNNVPSAQQWIPCSERLPEKTGYVLCTAEKKKAINIYNMDDKEKERYVCRGYYLKDEKCFCLHGRPAVSKVIAWQPLPEPYVEVEE